MSTFKPTEYNARDVLTLHPLPIWTYEEKKKHLEVNRIFHANALTRGAIEIITDAENLSVDWITDICCPSAETSLIMHIAKEMVVTYRVAEDELNIESQKVYKAVIADNPKIINEINKEIHDERKTLSKKGRALSSINLEKRAIQKIKEINKDREKSGKDPLIISRHNINSAKNIIIDAERKKITNTIVNKTVQNYIENNLDDLDLSKKTKHLIGKNHDYSFLGAAGSGKSTIARQFLTKEQKADCVVIATDNYRGITIPGQEDLEDLETRNIFAKTQDMAYMIKELVQEELDGQETSRPNIICDCITLDYKMQKLLAQGKATSAVAAYTGDPGFIGIAERADHRARDPNAAPADKGRFVHTTSLLEGHANASERLLTSIPKQGQTTIYDTNVEWGKPAIKIAKVDNDKKEVEIYDLKIMASFLNKKHMNVKAENQLGLITNVAENSGVFATHPENKSASLIEAAKATKYKSAYNIKLFDVKGVIYAEIISGERGVILNITNETIYGKKVAERSTDARILRAVTRQIVFGGIEGSLDKVFEKGEEVAFKKAYRQMQVDKSSTKNTKNPRKRQRESFVDKMVEKENAPPNQKRGHF